MRIRFYATLREAAETKELDLPVTTPTPLDTILRAVSESKPKLQTTLWGEHSKRHCVALRLRMAAVETFTLHDALGGGRRRVAARVVIGLCPSSFDGLVIARTEQPRRSSWSGLLSFISASTVGVVATCIRKV